MKSVTVREAQHNLARILREVEAGEIVRRKMPVARLVPIENLAGNGEPVDWEDHGSLMASVWKGTSISQVHSVLHDLRDER